ncbi:MAG TPA: hypothetical protein VGC85_04965 [Chthoniobacterales bacterium]
MIETTASKSFARTPLAHAVETPPPCGTSVPPLVWLNVLCLDAPLVAITWQLLFAKSFGIAVANGGTVALFLTAWLIYLADRLGDSMSLRAAEPMSLRQNFCRRHVRAWFAAVGLVALADLIVVGAKLDRTAVLVGAAVAIAALVYLLINRLRPQLWSILPLKEVSIGFIFAAGSMVGLLPNLTSTAAPAWIFFGLLCSLNCVSIAVWERALDSAQSRISIATAFPRIDGIVLPALAVICLTSSIAAGIRPDAHRLYVCIAASAVLLGLVHLARGKIQTDVRTALADLMLLTPIFAFVV